MIHPRDGFLLAYTKLKTRRIRLGISVFISSLLFIAVASTLFLVHGVIGSLKSYSQAGFGSRYMTLGIPAVQDQTNNDADLIARAKQIDKELVVRKTAEAKRLSITYDPLSEPQVVEEFDTPEGKQQFLSPMHPSARQALKEYFEAHPMPGIEALKAEADPYGVVNAFISQRISFENVQTYLQVMVDGREKYDHAVGASSEPTGLENFATNWQLMGGTALEPFLLPNQTLKIGDDGSIPILVPYTQLEEILGIDPLPKTAKAKDRLAQLELIRSKAAGYKFTVCYRNSSSAAALSSAIATQQDLALNKNRKDYIPPALITDVPAEACGPVRTTTDKRDAETKSLDAKLLQFQETFGQPQPLSRKLGFRIVGIVPDADYQSALSVQQVLQSILTSSLGYGWFTPYEVLNEVGVMGDIFKLAAGDIYSTQYYVEIGDAAGARRFLEERGCNPSFENFAVSSGIKADLPDPYTECQAAGKNFMLSPFGSNSLAIDEFETGFNKYFRYVLIGAMAVASLIMMGVVARVIADSRRETAVFRAIGAKRLDISQIYFSYVLMVSLIIAAISLAGGLLVGQFLQGRYATEMKIAASIAYNAPANQAPFKLYDARFNDVLLIIAIVLAVGFISALLPLFANLRRNPIRDMRDDR